MTEAARAANLAAIPTPTPAQTEAVATWTGHNPPPVVTIAEVAKHVEAARDAMGVAHVGLGSEFDGVPDLPQGQNDVNCSPALLDELSARGWSERDLALVAGENTLPVLAETEPATTSQ